MPDAQTPGAQPQQQQPPFGGSSATQPTPNRGFEAQALQRLSLIVKQLDEVVRLTGVTSDIGQAVTKAAQALSKLVPAGASSPAGDRNQIEQMAMRQNQQNQTLQEFMARQQQQGGQQAQQPKAA